MLEVNCIWQEAAMLGEGPLWSERENAIYWLDILNKKVHRYSLADTSRKTWEFDTEVTSLAEVKQGGFVATVRDGFAFIELDTGAITPIALPEAEVADNRFNDGKIDAQGRYWAGSMDLGETEATGILYCLHGDRTPHKMDEGYIISNGPAFSLDGRTLYHTDSSKRTIYAFDLAPDGTISNKRIFVQLQPEEGFPDGMTVDSEDCLWLAHFAGSRITRYSPQGEVLQVIPMPVPNITSCTFGGENLDTLYITTARLHMDEEALNEFPLAGSLFACKVPVQGLPTNQFGE